MAEVAVLRELSQYILQTIERLRMEKAVEG
jgi:hypothetical protein